MRAFLGFVYIAYEPAGMGFDPGTFGSEGEYFASELPGQMGNRILISI